jgi:hypothetical protein
MKMIFGVIFLLVFSFVWLFNSICALLFPRKWLTMSKRWFLIRNSQTQNNDFKTNGDLLALRVMGAISLGAFFWVFYKAILRH